MRMPDSLAALVDYGIIQEVVRPLMSGKEAQIYLVISEGEERVAKVYKDAQSRTFKHRAEYTEGRKIRNSRDQRAIGKRTRHGRAQDEAAWRSTEVEMIYRLRDAGVRVPEPHQCVDGVLVKVDGPPDQPVEWDFEVVGILTREQIGRNSGGMVAVVDFGWGEEVYRGAHVDRRWWGVRDQGVDLERLEASLAHSYSYQLGKAAILGQAADERNQTSS